MAMTTVGELVEALRTYELLPPLQVEEIRQRHQLRFPDAKSLAKYLVQKRWLTIYQYQQILQGAAAELTVGPYRILDPLGRGGVCQVYKAWDTKNSRIIALKMIHPDLITNTEAIGRLVREMHAATRLNHPNIVKALDVDLTGKRHYYALEFVEGTDLQRLLQLSGAMPVAQACTYARQAALGLQHAHELGLVHRDIKPGNLVRPEGTNIIKVLDFGLARLQMSNSHLLNVNLTTEGSLIGTADYLAPEQARAPSGVDIRADIYSLGCTLYHMLTGVPPFPGGSAIQKVYRHTSEEPTPVDQRCAEVPSSLTQVVARMMAKKTEDRFRTPAAVAAALAQFAVPASVDLAQPSWPPTPPAATPAAPADKETVSLGSGADLDVFGSATALSKVSVPLPEWPPAPGNPSGRPSSPQYPTQNPTPTPRPSSSQYPTQNPTPMPRPSSPPWNPTPPAPPK
jgi:serine/threonine-protein kinase